MKHVLIERDKMLNHIRQEEFNLMNEVNVLKKSLMEIQEIKNSEKQKNEEIQQKLDDIKVKFQETQKRNQDLQARCNELSKQCQKERKLR
jgi:chromosome segregation ATPase